MDIILDPEKIENESLRIIEGLLSGFKFGRKQREVVKRVIHATTDLDYAEELSFHPKSIESGLKAIKEGRDIICDVNMVKAGINKKRLSYFGAKAICLIDDREVVKKAAQLKIARSILAMRKAAKFLDGGIAAIGNAPTALFELCDLVKKGKVRPALIIGVPVGFVGAADSKRGLRKLKIPFITNLSRKGGSSVAAAITNALLKMAKKPANRQS